jgi:hypothetical protein
MRSPQQASDGDATLCRAREHATDLAPGAVETLVAIALEVGEVHPVARARLAQLGQEVRKILGAVDQHLDVVAHRPRTLTATDIDRRTPIATLVRSEEPLGGIDRATLAIVGGRPITPLRNGSLHQSVDKSTAVASSPDVFVITFVRTLDGAPSSWLDRGPPWHQEENHLMYIGLGTLVVILVIVLIIYFVRRA